MTANNAAMADGASSGAPARDGAQEKLVIATRFGEIEFDRAQAIFMPRGVLGFPGKRSFALTPLPHPGMAQFSLLQCLDDPELSFLIVPLDVDGGIIDRKDIDQARDALGISEESLAAVLIVTIREHENRPQISVNLRAPIFFDAHNRVGVQHVLTNSKYPVRHVLSDTSSSGATG